MQPQMQRLLGGGIRAQAKPDKRRNAVHCVAGQRNGHAFLYAHGRRAAFVPRVSRGVSRGAKARYDRYGEHERHAFE